MKKINLTVNEIENKERIDKYISSNMDDLSRNYVQKLINDGNILINGIIPKSNHMLKSGDEISINLPDSVIPDILPENIDLDILYEDEDVIVINKPKGMVVHPAAGHYSGTLVNALMHHCKDLSGINGVLRPGIVHRIDKNTSGVLIVCKNDSAHIHLAEQFKNHSINRVYKAIVFGQFKDDTGVIDAPIGRKPSDRKLMAINHKNGKRAVTHFKVLSTLTNSSFIECRLETGRTHQIRVHMASINHPVLGDDVYGGKNAICKLNGENIEGQVLHAACLGFVHPKTGKYMEFESPLPDYFNELLNVLEIK